MAAASRTGRTWVTVGGPIPFAWPTDLACSGTSILGVYSWWTSMATVALTWFTSMSIASRVGLNQGGVRLGDPLVIPYTPPAERAQIRLADMKGSGTIGILWSD